MVSDVERAWPKRANEWVGPYWNHCDLGFDGGWRTTTKGIATVRTSLYSAPSHSVESAARMKKRCAVELTSYGRQSHALNAARMVGGAKRKTTIRHGSALARNPSVSVLPLARLHAGSTTTMATRTTSGTRHVT